MKEFLEKTNNGNLSVVSLSGGEIQLRFENVMVRGVPTTKIERLQPNQKINLSAKYPKEALLACEKLKEKILKRELTIVN